MKERFEIERASDKANYENQIRNLNNQIENLKNAQPPTSAQNNNNSPRP
jgi:hypothetical protein